MKILPLVLLSLLLPPLWGWVAEKLVSTLWPLPVEGSAEGPRPPRTPPPPDYQI